MLIIVIVSIIIMLLLRRLCGRECAERIDASFRKNWDCKTLAGIGLCGAIITWTFETMKAGYCPDSVFVVKLLIARLVILPLVPILLGLTTSRLGAGGICRYAGLLIGWQMGSDLIRAGWSIGFFGILRSMY